MAHLIDFRFGFDSLLAVSDSAMCRANLSCSLGWKTWAASSALVMSFGCFDFFAMTVNL